MLHHRHPLFFFPVMLLLLHYAAFAFSAPASPFSSSSSEDTPNSILLADMPLLSSSSPFSNERSLLPGVQVFPSSTMGVPGTGQMMPSFQQSAGGFLSQRSLGGGGSLDLESWTKGQAMRANQENAVVAQLAQMAPHRRNQLVRDVANGNTSAANELVARLLRDLAESQHGQMAFPQLQQQQQAAMAMLMDQNGGGGGTFLGANSATGFGPTSALPLPLQLQLLAAQRQQQSMNGIGANRLFLATNGLPNGFATTSNGLLSPIPGLTAQSQFLNERLMRQLLLQQQNRPPLSPFSPSNDFSSDLSRPSPSSPFFNGQQGAAAFTQISPFSQSQQQQSLLSRPRGGVQGGMIGNNAADFGKTLSGAGGGLSSSSSSAFSPSSSSSFNSGGGFFRGMDEPEGISNNNGNGNNMATANSAGRGFVNDLGPEELFGGGGGGGGLVASTGQRKRSGKGG